MQYKRLGLEVIIPMFQGLNNDIELLIIGGIVES